MELRRILIAGEGGQGIQALAHVLTTSAFEEKKQVAYLPNFGVEQRGGVSLAFLQISDLVIPFPKFRKADILVLLATRAIKRVEEYVQRDTILVFDNSIIPEEAISHLKVEKIAIPASYLAKQKLIPKVFNIIMLSALVQILPDLKSKKVETVMQQYFKPKYESEPQLKHFNAKAFEIGKTIVKGLTVKK